MPTNAVNKYEFQYKEHQTELVQKYLGKHLLIVGDKVIDAYETYIATYDAGKEKYGSGNFLVQLCEPGQQSYTKRFHARITFKNPHVA